MKQLNPLTGLRGVAAYSVAIAHGISASFLYAGSNSFQPFAGRLAYFGMSLFFVLSGFVIHYNYAKVLRTEGLLQGGYRFIIARIARLFPLYALVIIFSLDHIPSHYFHNKHIGQLAYLTMTQSWFNLQDIMFKPAWSISTEFFFYFAFILLFPIFERVRKPALTLACLTVTVFICLPYFVNHMVAWTKNTNGWVSYFSPYTRIFEFILGVLVSQTFLSTDNSLVKKAGAMQLTSMACCIIWCLGVIIFDPFSTGRYSVLLSNFIYAPAIAPLLFLCCRYNSKLSDALSSRVLIFMGEISYSVYLLQFMIITGVAASYSSNDASAMSYINSCMKISVILGLTTFAAYGSYNLFEKPCRAWLRNTLAPRKTNEFFRASTADAYETN